MSNNVFDASGDGSVLGTAQSDVIYGGEVVGNADGGVTINDTIDGGQSNDTIYAGDGDDLIFGGDAGDAAGGSGGAKHVDRFEFDVADADPVQTGTGPGHIGDSILYRSVATAGDGTPISVRITVVDQTNPDLRIHLGFNSDYPVLINEGSNTAMQGESVDIKIEFLDNRGNPVTIDSNFTFRDIDDTGFHGNEGVTFDTTDITSYAVSGDPGTNVKVDDRGDEIEFTTNSNGGVADENLWTQVFFEGQSTLNFTVEARAHNAGYGFDTADFSNSPIITEVDASGDDLLYGGTGDDSALGGGGDDTIYGDEGDDRLDGGEGEDTLFGGSGSDTFVASEGIDTVFGGADQDFVDYSEAEAGITVDLGAGTSSDGDVLFEVDGVIGSSHADTLTGFDAESMGPGAFTTVFYGGHGNDVLDGRGGSDSLFGGHGDDTVFGGTGDDVIDAGPGADFVDSGEGNDSIDTGTGADTVIAGGGGDFVDAGGSTDIVYGGTGQDSILGGGGHDTLYGGAGGDTLRADQGEDTVFAGDGADVITDGDGNDTIFAGSGNDTVHTGQGADSVFGETGNDIFVLNDATGTNHIDGGTGVDVVDAAGASTGVNVSLGLDGVNTVQFGAGTTNFSDVEKLILTDHGDTVVESGTEVGLTYDVGAGDDSIQTGAGNDTVFGGAGNDTIATGPGDDVVTGGSGRDVFVIQSADYSDLGTEAEIKEALLSANNAGIDGWRGIKGEVREVDPSQGTGGSPQEGSGTGNAEIFDIKKIGDEVEKAMKPLVGSKDAKEAEKNVKEALEQLLESDPNRVFVAKDFSDVAFDVLKEDFGSIKAGIGALKAFGKASEQLEDATRFDLADLDVNAFANDIRDVLKTEIDPNDADALRNDIRDAINDEIEAGKATDVSLKEVSKIVYKVVDKTESKSIAKLAGEQAYDSALEQTGMTPGGEDQDAFVSTSIAEAVLERAFYIEITDFEIGEDRLDLSALDYLGTDGLSTNDVKVGDTAGDGSGDAVLNLPDGSSITLRGISVYDLDPEALEQMGFNASDDAANFQNEFLTDAGRMDGGGGDDIVTGGTGDDTVTGGAGNDTVAGGAGNDTVYGGEGNDSLTTGTGDDTLFGGDGDDNLANSSGDDILYGGTGNDTVTASLGDDTLYGGTDNDVMIGGADDDVLYGGSGDDSLVGGAEGIPTATNLSFEFYETDGETNSTLADVGFDASGNTTRAPDAHGTVDTIDVNDLASTHGTGTETFAVKLTTVLTVTTGGTYTFSTTSDDGSKLFVNGTEIVNNDGLHPMEFQSGSLALGTGEHVVEIIFFQQNGGVGLSSTISGPDTGNSPIDLASADVAASDDDLILGEAGNDQIGGGLGDDTIYGGDDQDTITIEDNFGSDTIYGGEGGSDDDTLDLGALGTSISVTLTGSEQGTFTDGVDTGTFFGIENVVLSEQDDVFTETGSINDPMTIDGRGGNDSISTGNGDDVIYGGTGNDSVDTDLGNDVVYGGTGDDRIDAQAGNDIVDGGSGNDSIDGGTGNDTIDGGVGNDQLNGNQGNDTVTGGAGDDTVILSNNGGNDTVTDFGTGGDQIDTSALTDLGNVLTDQDGTVTADEIIVSGGGGSAQVLTFPNGETLTVPDGTVDTSTTATQFTSLVAMGVPPCFAPGTMILTPTGQIPVETLKVGDLVMTADHGPQRLRWIGVRSETFGARDDRNLPILIGKHSLGDGFPTRDLIVSPQHRMVFSGKIPEILFGSREIMAIAKGLTDLKGIRVMRGKTKITYYALLFDRHQVIFAEGAATESFRPGPTVLKDMDDAARSEIYKVYPNLSAEPVNGLGEPARHLLNGKDSRRLARRISGHRRNAEKRKQSVASIHSLRGHDSTLPPTIT